jgi:hypothetical protein
VLRDLFANGFSGDVRVVFARKFLRDSVAKVVVFHLVGERCVFDLLLKVVDRFRKRFDRRRDRFDSVVVDRLVDVVFFRLAFVDVQVDTGVVGAVVGSHFFVVFFVVVVVVVVAAHIVGKKHRHIPHFGFVDFAGFDRRNDEVFNRRIRA